MKTIWKYELPYEDNFSIQMPKAAKILDVQVQHEKPCIWALVDDYADTETRTFFLFGTGHPVKPFNVKYIGTFQMKGGALVYHLFELDDK